MATKPQALIEDEENRRDRLREWIDSRYDGIVSRFTQNLGLSQSEIASILLGKKAFGESKARSIEELANMPPRYLDQKDASNTDAGITIHAFRVDEVSFNSDLRQLIVDKNWIKENIPIYTDLKNLKIAKMYGDSMEPTITPGDLVVVDTGINQIIVDGIYLLETQGRHFIKRVSQDISGKYVISSDNPRVKSVTSLADALEITIIGLATLTLVHKKI